MAFIIWNKLLKLITHSNRWHLCQAVNPPDRKCLESTKSDSDFFGVFKIIKGAGSFTAQLQKMIKYK